MRRSTVRVLALCGSLLLASAALAAPANLGTLEFFVVNEDGQAVENVLVQIATSEGEVLHVLTDEEGYARVDLRVRGQEPLNVTITTLGGATAEASLQRGETQSMELVDPMSRGYEWIWVD